MSQLGTEGLPLRVAIVGSGPSGFFAADALLKSEHAVLVDMFERLPTPFGLVRGGVAPDHPKIKSITRVYEKLATSDARFSFWGNVCIGRDLTVDELLGHYDAVLFASGAESDRRLGIPGEDLPGSHTATELVGWYNGHPDYRDRDFDFSQEVAVIIGQGNVAMDVARILAKTPDELRDTDIAEHALDALVHSRLREIYVVGRRGPAQARFTPPELRELGRLTACTPVVEPSDLVLDTQSEQELAHKDSELARQNLKLLAEYAAKPRERCPRSIHFRFHESPVELRGEARVEAIVLEKNRLEGEPFQLGAVGTGERLELACGLVFRSVGYRGVPLPGLPFDEKRGVVPNVGGRVVEDGEPRDGLYVAGWIKRGPSGVIGTNKPDAQETVRALLDDVPRLSPCRERDSAAVASLLRERGVRVVTFDDWRLLDAIEIERGRAKGKPREKLTRIEEMLALLPPR